MLKSVEFIRQHGLERLTTDFGIRAKRHPEYPNLVLLAYNQIVSPQGERIVQECRGLILDEADDWKVIAFPYAKFFNWGEAAAAKVDWRTARVMEKLDGSMMTLYHYDGKWHVATTGTPDAGGTVNGEAGLTFRDLFWRTWNALGYELPALDDWCFVFELMAPQNRVVVRHDAPKLVLHGARDLRTLQEEWADVIGEIEEWNHVESCALSSIEDVVSTAAELEGLVCEGFVVCDQDFNRIKVKGPDYLALHHMIENFTPKRMLEKVVLPNEGEEFLAYFPEHAGAYGDIKARFNALIDDSVAFYATVKHIADPKEFAGHVVAQKWRAACFAVHQKKAESFDAFYRTMPIDNLMRMIGLKDEPQGATA